MLPNIKEASIGTIDGLTLEKRPRTEWACLGVESLRISHHADNSGGGNIRLIASWLGNVLSKFWPSTRDIGRRTCLTQISVKPNL
jgi:hypothetical protein